MHYANSPLMFFNHYSLYIIVIYVNLSLALYNLIRYMDQKPLMFFHLHVTEVGVRIE